ncbi:MAG TPA: hypothetical protein VK461_14725 [Acidimicrobiales bacterium]|nr:hypothetical protein [Acidimicrobiales bacterium]
MSNIDVDLSALTYTVAAVTRRSYSQGRVGVLDLFVSATRP